MTGDNSLQSLLKTKSAAEREAVEEWSAVESVRAARERTLRELSMRRGKIAEEIQLTSTERRSRALKSSDGLKVVNVQAYLKRLHDELKQIDELIKSHQQELKRAAERSELAQTGVTDARIERKKIETVVANRESAQKIQDAAREELVTDEISQMLHGKK